MNHDQFLVKQGEYHCVVRSMDYVLVWKKYMTNHQNQQYRHLWICSLPVQQKHPPLDHSQQAHEKCNPTLEWLFDSISYTHRDSTAFLDLCQKKTCQQKNYENAGKYQKYTTPT